MVAKSLYNHGFRNNLITVCKRILQWINWGLCIRQSRQTVETQLSSICSNGVNYKRSKKYEGWDN